MKSNALSGLDVSDKTAKRAQTEDYEFSVPTPGVVVVRNLSYGDDEADDHTHAVSVEGGVPTGCSCKADEFGGGTCKHRIAVAIRSPVLDAADRGSGARKAVVTDGGQLLEAESEPKAENADAGAGCPHEHPDCESADAPGRPELCWEEWC